MSATSSQTRDGDGKTEMLADEPNPPGKKKSWGFHLLIDMSDCNDRIDDVKEVEQFFTDIIADLDMKPLSPCMVKKVDDPSEDSRGVSAVQMITTSSITFHSDEDERSVYLDIFSCRDFDPHQVLDFVQNYFEPSRMAHEMIYRDAGLSAGQQRH